MRSAMALASSTTTSPTTAMITAFLAFPRPDPSPSAPSAISTNPAQTMAKKHRPTPA